MLNCIRRPSCIDLDRWLPYALSSNLLDFCTKGCCGCNDTELLWMQLMCADLSMHAQGNQCAMDGTYCFCICQYFIDQHAWLLAILIC